MFENIFICVAVFRMPVFYPLVLQMKSIIFLSRSRKKKLNSLLVVPVRVLKSVANIISIPLSTIINQAISEGIYPSCLKTSKGVPIFKYGNKTDGSNYRPISILSALINSLKNWYIYDLA